MKIDIQTNKETYRQGESIRGEVILSTGDKELDGDHIRLELWEYVQGTGDSGGLARKKDENELMGNFSFPPGAEQRFKFEVKLPMNCRLSRESDSNTHNAEGWNLYIRTKTSKLREQQHKHYVWVNPAREFEAVYETCVRHLKFLPYGKAGQLTWGKETYFMMKSSDSSDVRVNNIYPRFLQDDKGGIHGQIHIGLKPQFAKSLMQRVYAFFKLGSTETRPLELTASQIFLSDGTVNHTEITKVINNVIDEVVASRR